MQTSSTGELAHRLERLGLSQYFEAFVDEGFDSWEIVLDITESDLNALNVKLGHRRKLQRAIAEARVHSGERPLHFPHANAPSVDGSYRSDESGTETKARKRAEPAASNPGAAPTKRKYRRHPKADEHAPERPPSAYVIFSNHIREELRGQDLSFTEIAKIVGERWQVLSPGSREACEQQASAAKEKYYAQLAEYKKTPEYSRYQEYLADFKAKHGNAPAGGKRSKLEAETSTSTQSSQDRRVSGSYGDASAARHRRSESTPPAGAHVRPGARSANTTSTSPGAYTLSGLNSPQFGESQSPLLVSPMSTTPVFRESAHDYYNPAPPPHAFGARDQRHDPKTSYGYALPQTRTASATSSTSQGSHFQSGFDAPPRRPPRDSASLPPLVHEDSALSSEAAGFSSLPFQGSLLPVVDAAKPQRLLPQPTPTTTAAPPLGRRPPLAMPPGSAHQDFRPGSSLVTLLRAGEMVRDAEKHQAKDPDRMDPT